MPSHGPRQERRPARRARSRFTSYGLPWANASNTPFRLYKHWVHEGGISTPLIANWPGVIRQGGKLTNQMGHLVDIMATCVDVGGAKYPKTYKGREITPLEGRSLRPVFEGKQRAGHPHICWEHEGNRAVRQGDWKLVNRRPRRLGVVRRGRGPHRAEKPGRRATRAG